MYSENKDVALLLFICSHSFNILYSSLFLHNALATKEDSNIIDKKLHHGMFNVFYVCLSFLLAMVIELIGFEVTVVKRSFVCVSHVTLQFA